MTTELLTVTGTLTTADGGFEPGAVATVKLVDSDGEVLAASAVVASGPTVDYRLDIDPLTVGQPDKLFIWAAVRSGDDWWGTLDLAPATGDDTIELNRVPQ